MIALIALIALLVLWAPLPAGPVLRTIAPVRGMLAGGRAVKPGAIHAAWLLRRAGRSRLAATGEWPLAALVALVAWVALALWLARPRLIGLPFWDVGHAKGAR